MALKPRVVRRCNLIFCFFQTTPEHANLLTPRAAREDTGEYTIKLRNPSGVVEGKINVEVLGMYGNISSHFINAV